MGGQAIRLSWGRSQGKAPTSTVHVGHAGYGGGYYGGYLPGATTNNPGLQSHSLLEQLVAFCMKCLRLLLLFLTVLPGYDPSGYGSYGAYGGYAAADPYAAGYGYGGAPAAMDPYSAVSSW